MTSGSRAFGQASRGTEPRPSCRTPEDDADQVRLSMDEIEAEGAVALPNKEVLSLLDVNADVDLGLDLGGDAHPLSSTGRADG